MAAGWPAQCMALSMTQADTMDRCRISCLNEPRCPVWQWSNEGGCWQGAGLGCMDRNGFELRKFDGSQRIQHGDISVLAELRGIQVLQLANIGYDEGDTRENIMHCRNYCYSNIECQYWQYAEGGCYVQDGRTDMEYPLVMGSGAVNNSLVAQTTIAGQFIMHTCPPMPPSFGGSSGLPSWEPLWLSGSRDDDPLGEHAGWRTCPYVIAVMMFVAFVLCMVYCIWDAERSSGSTFRDYLTDSCCQGEGSEDDELEMGYEYRGHQYIQSYQPAGR